MHFQSETIGELAKALAAAQGAMTSAAKDAANPHFKSRYADLSSIMDACRGPLAANHLSVTQLPGRREDGSVMLTTLLMHASGEHVGCILSAKPAQENPQVIGSILTYLRRYALAAVVGVVSDDDDGEAATAPLRGPYKTPTSHAAPQREAKPSAPPVALQEAAQRAERAFGGEAAFTMSTDCPKCGGLMWDNREKKTNPRAPDFKCRDKSCDGTIWKFKERPVNPIPGGSLDTSAGLADDEIPF